MDKTIPTYRMVLEFEIEKRKHFKLSLKIEEERKAFEAMMGASRTIAWPEELLVTLLRSNR